MNTQDYKTRTIFQGRENPNFNEAFTPVAIDIGYSAVKGFSQHMIYAFPSYAKKINGLPISLGKAEGNEIFYRDENDDIYAVGANAQAMISSNSVNDSAESLYGRNRYFSDVFRIVSRVGIALGLIGSDANAKLIIQTGLPAKYIKDDSPLLKEALAGNHSFKIKVGAGEWNEFHFSLTENDIRIMAQPMGTLTSITMGNNGRPSLDSKGIFSSNTLIFDAGFGTLDTHLIKSKSIADHQTFDFLGMKQVLQNTADRIYKEHGVSIEVAAMQNCLEKGTFIKLDRRLMKSIPYPFENILKEESQKVCMQALDKMKELYNYFIEIDYLVITGGTSAAWSDFIRNHLSGMETLKIVSGNVNDDIPYIFANVRGYYMFLINSLRQVA